jgi:hypothetical protein
MRWIFQRSTKDRSLGRVASPLRQYRADVRFRGQSGRVREGPNRSVISQTEKFNGVEILSTQGPESTQICRSRLMPRMSAIGSQRRHCLHKTHCAPHQPARFSAFSYVSGREMARPTYSLHSQMEKQSGSSSLWIVRIPSWRCRGQEFGDLGCEYFWRN